MTKLREPGSFPDALFRAVGLLGVPETAELLGCSTSLVRQYADPDSDRRICMERAAILDAALVAEGHGPLLFRWYRDVIDATPTTAPQGDPVDMALSAFASAGKMADVMRHAVCPMGDGGREITPRETDAARRAIAEVKAHLDDLDQRLATTQARYDAAPALKVAG